MRKIILLVFLTISIWAQGQDGQYIVFFNDKLGITTPYSIDQPTQFLSQRSIDRRKRQGISITEEDLPINPTYLAELARQVPIHYTLKWVNGVLVEARSEDLKAIREIASVVRIEYVAPPSEIFGNEPAITEVTPSDMQELINANQLAMLGLDKMHDENVFGEGITIAIFDSGFRGVNTIAPFQLLFQENRVKDTYDFVGRSSNVFRYHHHGTGVLSVMAADLPGVYIGGVSKATYQLYITEDTRHEYRVEEYNWMAAAERADSVGVDIINSSLGYSNLFDDASMNYTFSQLDGKTAVISQAAQKALSKGILVINAAGNTGGSSLKSVIPPSDVAGVIAVGAVKSTYELSSFSSIGPTTDGRIKPDVAALGEDVFSIRPDGTIYTQLGTSAACPLVTSLAAGLLQVNPTATPAKLYKLITESGTLSRSPNNQVGYGVPSYSEAINLPVITTLDPMGESSPKLSFFALYANPVSENYIEIQLNDDCQKKDVYALVLSIYNLQGKKILTSTKQIDQATSAVQYDITVLSSGLYLVKIGNKYQQQIFRILKL